MHTADPKQNTKPLLKKEEKTLFYIPPVLKVWQHTNS